MKQKDECLFYAVSVYITLYSQMFGDFRIRNMKQASVQLFVITKRVWKFLFTNSIEHETTLSMIQTEQQKMKITCILAVNMTSSYH